MKHLGKTLAWLSLFAISFSSGIALRAATAEQEIGNQAAASVLRQYSFLRLQAPEPPPVDFAALRWERVAPSIPWAARDSYAVYAFRNKLWLTGGLDGSRVTQGTYTDYSKAEYYNDIWASPDGMVWELVTEHAAYPPVRSSSVIFWQGALYMLGGWSPVSGYRTGIWRSEDGATWNEVASQPEWGAREGQKIVEFNNRLWMIGGVNYDERKTFNDVWVSDDAVHWALVTPSAPWHSRWDHDVAAFQGKLWLTGGMNFNGVTYGDEWSSEDGKNWQLVTAETSWEKRQGHGMAVWRDKMWVVGGLRESGGEGELADTWYTGDGYDWWKVAVDGPWLAREDHAVIVFKDSIWVLGGMDIDRRWNNDVWRLTIPYGF